MEYVLITFSTFFVRIEQKYNSWKLCFIQNYRSAFNEMMMPGYYPTRISFFIKAVVQEMTV